MRLLAKHYVRNQIQQFSVSVITDKMIRGFRFRVFLPITIRRNEVEWSVFCSQVR